MQAFLFAFPCFCFVLFAWTYALKRNALGSRARLRPHRRRDFLPEAVRSLGLKSDRFERPGGGADQVGVRGGAGAVG